MSLKEVVKWMLENGYGVMVGTEFIQTQKLNDELAGKSTVSASKPVTSNPPLIKKIVDAKELWNKFILDAEIPHRVNSSIGQYTVRQYNLAAANALCKVVSNPDIEYDRFVESTKNYYKTVSGKLTLSKYLINDVWKDEYMNWKKGRVIAAEGENRFED